MSNYDDYNPKNEGNSDTVQHRSRRAKKQREEDLARAAGGGEAAANSKKYRLNKKQFLKFVICIVIAIALVVVAYTATVIVRAPKIETDNIYSLLSQSSVLYDDEGEIIDNIFGDKNRTIVSIDRIPDHVQKAFIALEDKTFESHHGFNIIRIFGAIKDAVFHGGGISGTSTITQQLARNLYLEDKMGERSISRKITEAYYAVIL